MDWLKTLQWTGRIFGHLTKLAGYLYVWRERSAGRRQLLTLDHGMLKDIGTSSAEAAREAGKPFWKE
ncbi:MAG: hypothetical protein O7I42_09910 [Alphaproteobacteria bacterium]|nr:hypothetical protein [Alphaproteobacteria bacterium]